RRFASAKRYSNPVTKLFSDPLQPAEADALARIAPRVGTLLQLSQSFVNLSGHIHSMQRVQLSTSGARPSDEAGMMNVPTSARRCDLREPVDACTRLTRRESRKLPRTCGLSDNRVVRSEAGPPACTVACFS